MVEQIRGLDPQTIAANLERVRARAGEGVEILAATKYVPIEEMGALAEAGVVLAGENRQQDLAAKRERWGEAFEWDFIGNLQSRKVKQLLPVCRLIHSVASHSAIAQLVSHGGPDTEVLIEVNVAGEDGKSGFGPAGLGEAIEKLAPIRRPRGRISPALPSWPASTGCGVSRWAPPRTGRSRSTRARRSSAWARRCWCESAPNRA